MLEGTLEKSGPYRTQQSSHWWKKKKTETQDHKSVHILQLQISVKCYQTPYKTQGASVTFSSATLPPNFMHL